MLYPSGSHWNTWRDGATWTARDPSKFIKVIDLCALNVNQRLHWPVVWAT